jgi:hypothetical protein
MRRRMARPSTNTVGKSPSAGCRPSAIAFVGRPEKRLAAFLLVIAGEGDFLWSILQHFFVESRTIDGRGEGLIVHSRAKFAHVGDSGAAWMGNDASKAVGYASLTHPCISAIPYIRVVP